MDAATASLAHLHDPARYTLAARRVAIFKPHRRAVTLKDGTKKVVEVDKAQLSRILENMRTALRKYSKPVVIQPGHTLTDPHTPEASQPEPWGIGLNYSIESIGDGSEVGLAYDEYIRNDRLAEWKTYPFRSAEFYADTEEITRISLLRRDPALALGTVVSYERVGGHDLWHYSLGGEDVGTTINPAAAPDAAQDDADKDFMDKMLRCFKTAFPKLYALNEQAAPTPVAAPAVAVPVAPVAPVAPAAPHPPAPPPPPKEGPEKYMLTSQDQILYAKMQAEIAEMKQLREADRQERDALKWERELAIGHQLVTQLNAEGYYFRDTAKEAERFARLDATGRQERLAEVRLNYQRDPTAGSMLRTINPAKTEGPDVVDGKHQELALAYMRKHEDEYDDPEKAWEDALEKTAAAAAR
jgi:hypothetical protein